MSTGPDRGPGRDEDPAQRASDRPNTGPAPAGPAQSGDVPLPAAIAPADCAPLRGCTPDWLDDEGWAARVAAWVEEEEPADPDLEDGLEYFGDADAVIAEAREISAAGARDAAYAARMVFDGGFGAVAAAPGPRGPGNPGSAASFPGEHAGPAAGFGSGFALDAAPGCLALAEFAATAAGEDDRYPGASDDEVMGGICALDRVEAHVAARKLAAVAEFIRRRPGRDDDPHDSGKGGAHGPAKPSEQGPPQGTGQAAPKGARKGGPEKGTAQDPAKDGAGKAAARVG